MKATYISLLICTILMVGCKKEIINTNPSGEVVLFTTTGNNYWMVAAAKPKAYTNLTKELDKLATFPSGEDAGPIAISFDGKWLIFKSTKFNADAYNNGSPVVTIISSDFKTVITPSYGTSNYFEDTEGNIAIANNGDFYYSAAASGTHSRDIFFAKKLNNQSYANAENITSSGSYTNYFTPSLSVNEDNLLFTASNRDQYNGEAIGLVLLQDKSITILKDYAMGNNAKQLQWACMDKTGKVFFEKEDNARTLDPAERIWNLTSTVPVKKDFTNDNSPQLLPSGKIISLYLPAGKHHIKVMSQDGSNDVMLTESNSLFDEIEDIGISGGNIQ